MHGFEHMYVDARLAWGQAYRQFLLDQGVPPERIHVTGNLRQAVLRRAQELVSKDEVRSVLLGGRGRTGHVVVVAPGFTLGFASERQLSTCRRISRFVDKRLEMHRFYTQVCRALIVTLAEKHPEITFVVRPHPSKFAAYFEFYRNLSARYENVVCLEEGDFTWPLMAADLVIGSRSGAAVDAFTLGMPYLDLRENEAPFEDATWLDSPYDFFGRIVCSEEIEANLPGLISEKHRPEAPKLASRTYRQWIGSGTSNVFDSVVDAIERISQKPRVRWGYEPLYELRWRWRRRREGGGLRPHFDPDGGQLQALLVDRLRKKLEGR